MVIVLGGENWGLVGGHIEKGETYEETLKREVLEESNMRVIRAVPIGVQEVTTSDNKVIFQIRYCAIVEPQGKFEKDPAGNVTEVKLINPKDYRKYFDWGEIGERIIKRAIIIKQAKLDSAKTNLATSPMLPT